MKMKRKTAVLVAPLSMLLVIATLLTLPARAQQPIPHALKGTLTVDGQPAPIGKRIEARGTNVLIGGASNPITTTLAGQYGMLSYDDPTRLLVQGTLENPVPGGTPLRFYVNDMRAECQPSGGAWGLTFPYAEGTTTQLNLRLVSPVLRISKLNSTTARLSWDAVSGAASYALYRSTTPYFTPTDPPYQTVVGLSFDDVGALGNSGVNYFYQLKAVYDDGKSMPSNRVGEFDFSLTPGS